MEELVTSDDVDEECHARLQCGKEAQILSACFYESGVRAWEDIPGLFLWFCKCLHAGSKFWLCRSGFSKFSGQCKPAAKKIPSMTQESGPGRTFPDDSCGSGNVYTAM